MKRRFITIIGLMIAMIMTTALYCNVFAETTYIDRVEFNGVKVPAFGAKIQTYGLISQDQHANMDPFYAGWYQFDEEGNATKLTNGDTFKEGTFKYYFKVLVDTNTEYALADNVEVIMNGESWGEVESSEEGDLSYFYMYSPEYTIGHDYHYDHTEAATADAPGKYVYKCDRCEGYTYDEIPAIGTVAITENNVPYNREAQTPELSILDANGNEISSDFYTVTMPEDMIYADTYPVKVEFKDQYAGSYDLDFVIDKAVIDLSGVKWNYTKALAYSGSAKTVKLANAPAYTTQAITGNSAVKVGTYTASAEVVLDDPDNYELAGAVKTLTWKIVPAKASVAKTTPGTKKLTVKMSKKASGYGAGTFQIAYKVKGTSTWKYVKTTMQSKTIKSLKAGKAYNIKVRAIKTVGGKTYNGAWSKIYTTGKIK